MRTVTPPLYVVDTHALYWHEFAPKRLPPRVVEVFGEVEAGRAVAVLLPIVLAEFYYVLRKENLGSDALLYLQYVFEASAYRLEPLTWDDVLQLPTFPEVPEMHDRLIAIAAKRLDAVVLTRDPELHASPQIRCLWCSRGRISCGRNEGRGGIVGSSECARFAFNHTLSIFTRCRLPPRILLQGDQRPCHARFYPFAFVGLIATAGLLACLAADEVHLMVSHDRWKQHDNRRPRPAVVEPVGNPVATSAPGDAVILFDGTNLDGWQSPEGGAARWKVTGGSFEVAPGTGPIQTKAQFGDVQLHVEWASPSPAAGKGQDRGNSGIFLMGLYELQVLDSYRADTYADGQAGAIYGQFPPLSNASRPPGEWQAYDIAFRRPRFDKDGKLTEPARVTLFHNGILVQNTEELFGQTSWLEGEPYEAHGNRGPIQLQDHGHPVRFRNIWIRDLPERCLDGGISPGRRSFRLSVADLDSLTPGNTSWG